MTKHHETILIVDDEVPFAEFVAEVSRNLGYQATCAPSAKEFLATDLSAFQGIVLDLNMPDFDGIEVIRYLSDVAFSGAIIMLSGVDAVVMKMARGLAEERGLRVASVICKPVEIDQLEAAIVGAMQPLREGAGVAARPECHIDEGELRAAIETGQFEPFYQPKVCARTRTIKGFEALARWRHPSLGIQPPGAFLNEVIRFGLTDDMTECLLAHVARDIDTLRRHGTPATVALNFEAESLEILNLPERIAGHLNAWNVKPDALIIEVTENGTATILVNVIDNLLRLRMRGFKLSIDDFGTGHSTLSQLRQMPFGQLKIDRSFVIGIGISSESEAIVTSTIDLAKKLDLEIVAEGVETHEQMAFLRDAGCDQIQGYLIARPMPIDETIAWCKSFVTTVKRDSA